MNDNTLRGLVGDLLGTERSLIQQTKTTGAWMSVRGSTVLGAVLLATKFCDVLCAHYNFTPLNLQIHCNGCGTAFKVSHALS